ncbi:NADH-quinone oxidoreductase%2C E subunit NuoE [Mycobacteroides abscessus]|nr:NADH-quinone oxidoreductase%2C E subunit NuoE [Mycobacteroides abscessus]
MTEIFVELGGRPSEDEGRFAGRKHYPAEVVSRLAIDAKEILDRYPSRRSALLPLLHLVQSEDGYVTMAGIEFCARQVELTSAEVTAVASFYSMYRREPTGDYLVGVCTNTLCAVLGGDAILARLAGELGVHPGGTTEDGKVTLEHIECNAGCDYAPVLMVNWEFFDNQTPDEAAALVQGLRRGMFPRPDEARHRAHSRRRPGSWRGSPMSGRKRWPQHSRGTRHLRDCGWPRTYSGRFSTRQAG